MRVKPYGSFWHHLLRGNIRLAYRAIFGWRVVCPRPAPVLDNFGLTVEGALPADE